MTLRLTMFFICFLLSYAPVQAQESVVEIQVSNILFADGTLLLALYNDETNFLTTTVVQSAKDPVHKSGTQTILLSGIRPGDYAIGLFHDVNDNGKMDKNFLGIPKESYGFSNNPRLKFGPPKFNDAKFSVQKQHQILKITLK